MRIDVFCHFFPPRFLAERNRRAGSSFGTQYSKYFAANPGLSSLDIRFRTLDQFPDVRQLLTIAGPNIESITSPPDTVELARMLLLMATITLFCATSGRTSPMVWKYFWMFGVRRFTAAKPGSRSPYVPPFRALA